MELNLEHRSAAHCENGAISALLRYHGIDLSEPMIFGLASGLFFSHVPFVDVGGMPLTFPHGARCLVQTHYQAPGNQD